MKQIETGFELGRTDRRRFLRDGGLALAGLAFAPSAGEAVAAAGPSAYKVRLGGPLSLDSADPEAIAKAHREAGYSAAYCPPASLNDSGHIRAIEKAFARQDVVLAEVGRWVNLLDADPAKRAANLKQVTEGLALADAVGARCCVDIAGSYSKEAWYGPDPRNFSREFFDAAVENARAIIDAVKPGRSRFCYEMMGWAIPESPDRYLELIRAVDRPAFAVHLDPCNLVNCPERFYRNTDLLNECFDKLGKHIVSCHAKDLSWEVEMNIHFKEVRPGAGSLDYVTYLKRLGTLPQQPPLMLEHLPSAEEYDRARRHLINLARESNVPLA
jgi:sugar phosphate isomerase/epimerase